MSLAWEYSKKIDITADCYQDVFSIPYLPELTPIYFVKLSIDDENGSYISDNFYWLSSRSDDAGCFVDLKKLSYVAPKTSFSMIENGAEGIIRVKLENPTDKLAFFIRVILTKGEDGEEVLPVYWSDNYFNILPGETKEAEAVFALKDLDGAAPFVRTEGWNMD